MAWYARSATFPFVPGTRPYLIQVGSRQSRACCHRQAYEQYSGFAAGDCFVASLLAMTWGNDMGT